MDYIGTRTGEQIDNAVTEVNETGNHVVARLRGEGPPTASTAGRVGDLYTNTLTGKMYHCTSVSNVTYTWEKASSSSLPETTALIKGDGEGGAVAATAGTDYVEPVSGKGLSTNDYTTAEKIKLAGIESEANRTVIDSSLIVQGAAADAKAVGDAIAFIANFKGITGAGLHNSIYRGKYLGSALTSAQSAAIRAGTFDDLWVGDYWTINGHKYWAAHADYRLHCGDTELTTHHMLVIPDVAMYSEKMNDTNVTTGGYYGSKMKTTRLAAALAQAKADFGADHILTHKVMLTNAVSNGAASSWAWYDSQIDLMSEAMVYGHNAWGAAHGYETGADKTQLALFQARPDLITTRTLYWLRDVSSAANFCGVNYSGHASYYNASASGGVRPAFLIY